MGLPKNYQQTVNLTKRVDSLNDLFFYEFEYSIILTKKTINEFYDKNKSFDELEDFLGELNFVGNKKIIGRNRINAFNSEIAKEKLSKWLGKSIDLGIIESYEILNFSERSFKEELENKNLLDLLNFNGG
jgi:hypothetical protein